MRQLSNISFSTILGQAMEDLVSFLRSFLGVFVKGNIHQKDYYQKKRAGNLGSIYDFYEVHFSNSSSIFTAANKNIIPKTISLVNVKINKDGEILAKMGVMNAIPNQAAARFVNNPDSTLNHGLVKNISIIL